MKVYLETYGCQMNVADSELIRSILVEAGHELSPQVDDSDVVLVNGCAIRENAYRKTYGRLDLLRPLRLERQRESRPFVVGVLGCMAQNMKEALFRHPVVNLVAGPDSYRALPDLIAKAGRPKEGGHRSGRRPKIKKEIDADLSIVETYSGVEPLRFDGVNAWVVVMRGCDNFCTFCVVPYTRGRERSRPKDEVLEEVQGLAEEGFKQVTFLGQNVNSYRTEGASFADLLLGAAEVPGIERVRFTSPHPKDFPEPLLEAIAAHPKICSHIHLPLQAGSDRILDLMKRTYTRTEFLSLVDQIRATIPNVALTTDLIVGFPTETEADFQDTFDMVERVGFDSAYIFKYSERIGTIAARDFPDEVSPKVKTDRIVRLFDLQHRIALEKNRDKIGKTFEVLIEGEAEKRVGHQIGKTEGHMMVVFPSTGLPPGALVPVEIKEASPAALFGEALRLSVLNA